MFFKKGVVYIMGVPFLLSEKVCPVCGKLFYPTPYHTFYDKRLRYKNKSDRVFVCSYSCFRFTEKTSEIKQYRKKGD